MVQIYIIKVTRSWRVQTWVNGTYNHTICCNRVEVKCGGSYRLKVDE